MSLGGHNSVQNSIPFQRKSETLTCCRDPLGVGLTPLPQVSCLHGDMWGVGCFVGHPIRFTMWGAFLWGLSSHHRIIFPSPSSGWAAWLLGSCAWGGKESQVTPLTSASSFLLRRPSLYNPISPEEKLPGSCLTFLCREGCPEPTVLHGSMWPFPKPPLVAPDKPGPPNPELPWGLLDAYLSQSPPSAHLELWLPLSFQVMVTRPIVCLPNLYWNSHAFFYHCFPRRVFSFIFVHSWVRRERTQDTHIQSINFKGSLSRLSCLINYEIFQT